MNFCPKCTSEVIFNGRVLICKSCQFELWINVASTATGVIFHEDKVLLLERAKDPERGKLDIPGGFMEPGETAEQALRREIKEETGLILSTLHYLGTYANNYPYKGFIYSTCDIAFTGNAISDQVDLSEESAGFIWASLDKLNYDDLAFDNQREILKQARLKHENQSSKYSS